MTIQESIKSGRRVRRNIPSRHLDPGEEDWITFASGYPEYSNGETYYFSREDLIADDWEVEE